MENSDVDYDRFSVNLITLLNSDKFRTRYIVMVEWEIQYTPSISWTYSCGAIFPSVSYRIFRRSMLEFHGMYATYRINVINEIKICRVITALCNNHYTNATMVITYFLIHHCQRPSHASLATCSLSHRMVHTVFCDLYAHT